MIEKYTGIDTFSTENIPLYFEAAKNGCVVAFDTETTGLHNHDDVVQLAWAIMEKGEIVWRDFTYVQNLSVPLEGTEAQKVNKLTDSKLALEGRYPREVWSKFYWMLDGLAAKHWRVLLVAHNLPFDLRMVQNNAIRYGIDEEHSLAGLALTGKLIGCDTKEFVRQLKLPKEVIPDCHLSNCVESFALDAANTHDALDDTLACLELFRYLTKEG